MNWLKAVEKSSKGTKRRGPPYLRRNPERTDTTAHQSPGGVFSDLVYIGLEAFTELLRSAVRNRDPSGDRNLVLGFRVGRTLLLP